MKGFSRGDKGFTLVELLIVIAILGVLAAVVIPSVLGLMGRGASQAYNTDEEVIQLAVATFWADTHAGADPDKAAPASALWGVEGTDRGHYYPTAIADADGHELVLDLDYEHRSNDGSYLLMDGAGVLADDADISAHAIWMGLLVNNDGKSPGAGAGTTDRGAAAPLGNETALYLQEMPESAMADATTVVPDDNGRNGAPPETGGGYCWIVGENGQVYGAYKLLSYDPEDTGPRGALAEDEYWFAGFGGSYP